MPTFKKLPSNTPLAVNLVLRQKDGDEVTLRRITHIFSGHIYSIKINEPRDARYAERPSPTRLSEIEHLIRSKAVSIGKVGLPAEFLAAPEPGTSEYQLMTAAYHRIHPLMNLFSKETNLGREKFTQEIRKRASALGMSEVSLRRLLLRWWYFGEKKQALLGLKRGRESSRQLPNTSTRIASLPLKKPGRRHSLSDERGPNEFHVTAADISDMLGALSRLVEKIRRRNPHAGSVTLSGAYKEWLHNEFARRNGRIYERWLAEQHVPPLSVIQYRRYVRKNIHLADDRTRSIFKLRLKRSPRSLDSAGAGEVYELDSTGGQILLIVGRGEHAKVYEPTIYFLIDRATRFIVSVYVTLRKPSWEALRIAIRISFTSRSRFENLGIPVTDAEWPLGVIPIYIVTDRGPEMISEEMLTSAVDGMGIIVKVLAPWEPDGKGVVERVIEDLKDKMKRDPDLPAQYLKFSRDPKLRKSKKKAEGAAVRSLVQLYKSLVEKVLEHNNAPHSFLEKQAWVKAAGIPPVPREAYAYGRTHITGLQQSPLSDEELELLTLVSGKGTLRDDGTMGFDQRTYFPANERAHTIVASGPKKSTPVRWDPTMPEHIYVPARSFPWAMWRVDDAGAANIASMTIEEHSVLRPVHQLVAARAKDAELRSTRKGREVHNAPKSKSKLPARRESDDMVRALQGHRTPQSDTSGVPAPGSGQGLRPARKSLSSIEELDRLTRARVVEMNRRKG
jgi:hypothetical protein